jgi:hypothetical protein
MHLQIMEPDRAWLNAMTIASMELRKSSLDDSLPQPIREDSETPPARDGIPSI